MANQSLPVTNKKKLRFLLIPFVILGVLILIMRFPAKITMPGSSNSSSFGNSSVPTRFSPEELAVMANKNSVNYVAGECSNKEFVEFAELNWTLSDGKQHNVFSYYYGEKITTKRKEYYYSDSRLQDRYDDMAERITPIGDLGFVHFTIKDKKHYEEFAEYIKSHSSRTITENKKYTDCVQYAFNNAVFIDCGYLRGFNGYCFEIYPLNGFNPAADTGIADTIKKELPLAINPYSDKLNGLWKGQYGDKNISLAILKINLDTVWGYSSVNGNFANFEGKVSGGNSGYVMELKEKEAKLNGVFNLSFDSTENTISGKWQSYDGELSGDVSLSRAVAGDRIKIIADKAFLFSEHEYKSQTKAYFISGDEIQYDSLSTIFVHCTYNINQKTTGWVLIKKVAFQ